MANYRADSSDERADGEVKDVVEARLAKEVKTLSKVVSLRKLKVRRDPYTDTPPPRARAGGGPGQVTSASGPRIAHVSIFIVHIIPHGDRI